MRFPRLRDDRGSVLLLGLGAVIIGLIAVVVGVDASAAYLQRRALVNLADATALAGAQAIDLAAYYRDGANATTSLDPVSVRVRVQSFLEESAGGGIDGVRVEGVTTDGRSVAVLLSAPLRLPFRPADERIAAEATAVLAYRSGA